MPQFAAHCNTIRHWQQPFQPPVIFTTCTVSSQHTAPHHLFSCLGLWQGSLIPLCKGLAFTLHVLLLSWSLLLMKVAREGAPEPRRFTVTKPRDEQRTRLHGHALHLHLRITRSQASLRGGLQALLPNANLCPLPPLLMSHGLKNRPQHLCQQHRQGLVPRSSVKGGTYAAWKHLAAGRLHIPEQGQM